MIFKFPKASNAFSYFTLKYRRFWYRKTFEIGIDCLGLLGGCPRRPLSRRRLLLLGPGQWLPVPCGGCPRRPLSRRRLLLLGPRQWLPVPCGGCPRRPLSRRLLFSRPCSLEDQDGYDAVGFGVYGTRFTWFTECFFFGF